ncbi:hypothetical protein GCM10022234_32640 [Aeromicrobium panaciterrae]|uniref:hypothetical protein n=1 Tax=Aeromicrobium panaciterrae TaxID=363861 RepID=UPI0031D8800C
MSTLTKALGVLTVFVLVTGTSSCRSQSDSVKDQWAGREKFSGCGSIELSQGDTVASTSHSEVTCMTDALDSGSGAELLVSSPTTEGDRVRDHYRLYPDGHLELYIDSSDDPYAGDDWELIECIRPVWLPRVTCSDAGPS